MSALAGFAVSVFLGEKFFNAVVGREYATIGVPTIPVTGGELFVAAPIVSISEGAASLFVELVAWGTLTNPASGESHNVIVNASATIPVNATIGDDGSGNLAITLALDAAHTVVSAPVTSPFFTSPFSAAFAAFVAASISQQTMQRFVAGIVNLASESIPPFTLNALADALPYSIANRTALPSIARAGCLCIGLQGKNPFLTGDVESFSDGRQGRALAIWVNALAYNDLFGVRIRAQVADAVQKIGGTLDSMSIQAAEGAIVLGFQTTVDTETVTILVVLAPSHDGNDLTFTAQTSVNIELAWWQTLLTLLVPLPLDFTTLTIQCILSILGGKVADGVGAKVRTLKFSFAQGSGSIEVDIAAVEAHALGFFIGCEVAAHTAAGSVDVATSVTPDQLRDGPLDVRAFLPFGVRPDDPFLRVTWTARRLDQNVVIARTSGPPAIIGDHGEVASRLDLTAHADAPLLNLTCGVTRISGERLFGETIKIRVVDRIRQDHPYVQWSHEVMVPASTAVEGGLRLVLATRVVDRTSVIHRTKFPGRCRMVGAYSHRADGALGPGLPAGSIRYFDALPFPEADLPAHRAEICDYCFYGGPASHVLLP